VSGDPSTWPSIEALGSGFEVGDQVFLQEEWCKGDWGVSFVSIPIRVLAVLAPRPHHAPEGAQHWFKVTGVRVTPMDDLSQGTMIDTGIAPESIFDGEDGAWLAFWLLVKKNWNAAHPEHSWNNNPYVVVLDVGAITSK
jgi:hypothetical protein